MAINCFPVSAKIHLPGRDTRRFIISYDLIKSGQPFDRRKDILVQNFYGRVLVSNLGKLAITTKQNPCYGSLRLFFADV